MENLFVKNKAIKDTKVVVAMSGGVDSSVVAVMLHKAGYNVVGITLQLYDLGVDLEKKGACCAGKDIYDAKNVADSLGFPHYVLNYESVFKQEVMEDFADSYLRGETPIPCVKCNQSVKFRDLFKMAKDLNADALATGHYVQRIIGPNNEAQLHRAIDLNKDQSYFLFATTKEQLEYIHFPLGGFTKEHTRELAKLYGLEIHDKPDSQDICFVPNGSYTKVIERLRPDAFIPGDIIDLSGKKLGEHRGIAFYTKGQRRGLNIGGGDALYVVKIDAKNNQVIVGSEEDLGDKELIIRDVNWLMTEPLNNYPNGLDLKVRLRSASELLPAKIYPIENNQAKVVLAQKARAVTKGQACVAYLGTQVLGGGFIC